MNFNLSQKHLIHSVIKVFSKCYFYHCFNTSRIYFVSVSIASLVNVAVTKTKISAVISHHENGTHVKNGNRFNMSQLKKKKTAGINEKLFIDKIHSASGVLEICSVLGQCHCVIFTGRLEWISIITIIKSSCDFLYMLQK